MTTSGTNASVAARMAEAATNLLAALEPEQRRKASFDFPADEERRLWFYTPTDHGGVPLVELNPLQQQRVHQLVASGLSVPGYATAAMIMGLENVLDAVEGWRVRFARDHSPFDRGRNPQMYYISIFGDPGGSGPWGWRFGGHHVSLHYTIADGRVAAMTPAFFGSDPAETRLVGPGLLRPLAGEEDLGRELIQALDAEQRSVAVLTPVAPWDLVGGNRASVEEGDQPPFNWTIFREQLEGTALERAHANQARWQQELGTAEEHTHAARYTRAPKGLPASRMTTSQRQMLVALIRQYVDRMPEEVAEAQAAKIAGSGPGAIHFAWAGGLERRQPHYYRIQGPRLLIEYDNTQNQGNHVHSVWRDPKGDFGADLLAQHYAQAH